MTKTKSLVSSVLDDAVLFFPVDSERYELANAVHVLAPYGMRYLHMYQHGSWRVNDWLRETDSKVRNSVQSYLDFVQYEPNLATMDEERARRVEAALRHLPISKWLLSTRLSGGVAGDWLHAVLWLAIDHFMQESTDFIECSLRTGGFSQ